jgi:hypothetical protein
VLCADADALSEAIVAAEIDLPAWSQADADGRGLMRGDRVRLADGRIGRAIAFTHSGRTVTVRVHRAIGPTAVDVPTGSVRYEPVKRLMRRAG